MRLFFFALESNDDVSDERVDDSSGSGFSSGSYVFHDLNSLLIVQVDCYLAESHYSLVVSVEQFEGSKFPTQKLL